MLKRTLHVFLNEALLCAVLLCAAVVVARPLVEMGVNDDFTYFATANTLAATGHLSYYGTNAMLGVQLLIGAAFIKLFGSSFFAVRLSMFLPALATAALLQRTLLRCGLNRWNATLTTLIFFLSPLYLPLAFSFMTDGGGLYCFVLALYCCVRAVQAPGTRASIGWLVFAAASNVVLGTVRQTAWLGVIVMVPCAAWLLRKRRGVVPATAVTWVISLGSILAALHWFHQQPYALPEHLLPGPLTLSRLHLLLRGSVLNVLGLSLFLVPVLIAFVSHTSWRRVPWLVLAALLAIAGVAAVFLHQHGGPVERFLEPFTKNYATEHGALDVPMIYGERPVVLHEGARLLLTVITMVSLLFTVLTVISGGRRQTGRVDVAGRSAVGTLLVLIGPLTICYALLLLPRMAFAQLWDRYLLTPFLCLLILLAVYYQERIRERLPAATLVALGVFSIYAVVSLHDAYSLYRGRLRAVDELRRAGIPPTAIRAGFEYDGLTQIQAQGYTNDPTIDNPPGGYKPPDPPYSSDPLDYLRQYDPAVVPRYLMSFDPKAGSGLSEFAPVAYETWLAPYRSYIYVCKP